VLQFGQRKVLLIIFLLCSLEFYRIFYASARYRASSLMVGAGSLSAISAGFRLSDVWLRRMALGALPKSFGNLNAMAQSLLSPFNAGVVSLKAWRAG
jgi:hypothetical protein